MIDCMSSDDNKVLEDHNIYILGPLNLQNEFLLYVVERELGVNCQIYDQDLRQFYVEEHLAEDAESLSLILIDSAEQSYLFP